jgi:hypothetical protein
VNTIPKEAGIARYKIVSPEGDELGTGRWQDWFWAGDVFHFDGSQQVRVVSVKLFEDEAAEFDGLLVVEPTAA